MGVVRILVTSARVGAGSSARAGVGMAGLVVRRGPSLVTLAARATIGAGPGGARAESGFRDELLTLFDDVAEIGWRQTRRARDELGMRTSPAEPSAEAGRGNGATAAASNGVPRRHRVKI